MTWPISPRCSRSKNDGLLRASIAFVFLSLCAASSHGQYRYLQASAYSTTGSAATDSLPKRSKWEQPGIVALQSAVVPGLGQITNGQIWKVPIIYGGGFALAYWIRFNNQKYQSYRQAYKYRTDDDTNTIDEYPLYSERALLLLREDYHTARDLSVIVTVVAYAANILDAYVYAHLKDFDVSNNMRMQVQPVNLVNIAGRTTCVASIKFNLK
jgi:hypothetical protein